jgi:Domain of unknown function DUF1828
MSQVDIKKLLCEGFCSGVKVSQSGKLFNVSVPFEIGAGEPVNFYVVPEKNNCFRIEDDGSLIPFLLATGVNLLDEGTRRDEFQRILSASGVTYNDVSGELVSKSVSSEEIAGIIFGFINVILKIDALKTPLRPENVANMFKQDAQNKISESFDKTIITYEEALSKNLADFLPDIIIRSKSGRSAAIYLLTNNQRAWEAIALRYKARHEEKMDCSVVALLDKVGTKLVSNRSIASVHNNLDATPYFYDNQHAAMTRIAEEIGMEGNLLH